MVIHVEYASIAGGAVVGSFWFEDVTDETVFFGPLLHGKALCNKINTQCIGTRPGSFLMVIKSDQASSRTKTW
jgi:hypothetical protein